MTNLYTKSGVNIQKGNEVVKKIKSHVASTHNKAVLRNIGSFGGLYNLTDIVKKYKNPVLVQSIDGVGTKVELAERADDHSSIAFDLMGTVCDDAIIRGGEPVLVGSILDVSSLGKGEELTGGREKPSILSDAYEAVIAAVYLDGGFETAFSIISRQFSNLIDEVSVTEISRDYKTELQEHFCKLRKAHAL